MSYIVQNIWTFFFSLLETVLGASPLLVNSLKINASNSVGGLSFSAGPPRGLCVDFTAVRLTVWGEIYRDEEMLFREHIHL